MAMCAAVALGLFAYMMLFGTFPFNAFLSAFFCAIGMFVLTGETRLSSLAVLRFPGP